MGPAGRTVAQQLAIRATREMMPLVGPHLPVPTSWAESRVVGVLEENPELAEKLVRQLRRELEGA